MMFDEYIYDVEVFKNFFCATFMKLNSGEFQTFVIHQSRNDVEGLCNFLQKENLRLIGFNNIHYDGVILNYVIHNTDDDNLLANLFDVSSKLVSDDFRYDKSLAVWKYMPKNWVEQDLMKIMAFDKLGVSLKQTAINLKWKKIQDLPIKYDALVEDNQVDLIVSYNVNDVLITNELYKAIKPQIDLRFELSKIYNADLSSASDSKMGNIILEHIYTTENNIPIGQLRNLRTKHEEILLKYCIASNVYFKTETLKKLKESIEKTTVRKKDEFSYKKILTFGGTKYEIGSGGLHSKDDARIFVENENYVIYDQDYNSYYPFIIINNNIYPSHLGTDFVKILDKITNDRINAKKNGDKIRADGLKITINSTFGKLGSDTFWLEDAKALLTVTITGQLYLLMLIERLVLNGIKVISANTDGIVSKIPRDKLDLYFKICNDFADEIKFGIEFTQYSMYARSDVNNYVVKKHDGKTKEKGRYLREIDLKKGYKHPIVAKAMYEYFVNGKPVEDTIVESRDIFDFCISQKTGGDFVLEYRVEGREPIKLQKNNRFFISKDGGSLVKVNSKRNSEIGLFIGEKCRILNDYDDRILFENYDIKYQFYVNEAKKYIDKIVPDNDENFVYIEENYENNEQIEENSPEKDEILNELSGIKNLSKNVIDNLVFLKNNYFGTDFLDFLIFCEENDKMAAKFADLIKVNYFVQFGENSRLLFMFEEFTKGKSKYDKKLVEKTKVKRLTDLKFIFENNKIEKTPLSKQIEWEKEILGRIKTKFDIDVRNVVVNSIEKKYSPKLTVYCLAKGTTATLKVQAKYFNNNPIEIGDIIFCKKLTKKNCVRKTDTGWEDIPDKFDWWLDHYEVVKGNLIV